VETLKIAKLFQTLYNLSKPSLARVHGCALNCGAALAAACDMAVGEYGADFSLSDLRIGMIPATLTPYVTKAMGERWARHHFLCGETFTAAEAYRTGLLTDITPPEELDGRINELLGQIIQGAPDAQTALKAWMRASAGMPITPEIVKTGADMTAASCTADEFKRGLDDIIAKRKPFWLKKKPSSPSKKPARQKS
jgi:methylglutaconyl-CoA hydratase